MRRALLSLLLLIITTPLSAAADGSASVRRVLLSRQLMRDARVAVGDMVLLAVEPDGTKSVRFQVAGVYEPVPDPMKFNTERYEARLNLPDLIALTGDVADPQAVEAVTAIN